MSLTANSDITGRFHEDAFNTIISEIMQQRPFLFNYASKKIIDSGQSCTPIKMNKALQKMETDKWTEVDKLPIVGADNPELGIDYCLQLKELKLDFSPESEFSLPPELGDLAVQQFALKGTVCAGIECDAPKLKKVFPTNVFSRFHKLFSKSFNNGLAFFPFDRMSLNCFCLSLYAKVIVVEDDEYLKLKLLGIELQDIAPLGLENAIECYLKEMLNEVVFPKIKMAVDDLVFNVEDYFSVGLTPTSSALPYNPNVSNNYLSIYLNVN